MSVLCERLWEKAFTLLGCLVQTGGREALTALGPTMVKHWHTVAGQTPASSSQILRLIRWI